MSKTITIDEAKELLGEGLINYRDSHAIAALLDSLSGREAHNHALLAVARAADKVIFRKDSKVLWSGVGAYELDNALTAAVEAGALPREILANARTADLIDKEGPE